MENSGHSFTEGYSEGSEPIKLTDAKRIEKEAVAFATEILGEPPFMMDDTIVTGYIAGANSEREHLHDQLKQRDETIKQLKEALKGERNKAIDECMREIERLNDDGVLYESTARKVLEFLKSDSK